MWEYAVGFVKQHTGVPGESFSMHQIAMFSDELNDAGAEGWEAFSLLQTSNGYVLFYKRPKR